MTLRHIKIFLTVCECGNNLTKAAEKLFIAQPSVSFAIHELEDFYNIKFFDRISRRLYITEAGKMFWNYASHISALFEDMEKNIRDWDKLGILRIGGSITVGSQLMPSYVKIFSEAYPAIDVRVFVERSEKMEQMLLRNELDFAVIEGIVHEPNLVGEEYMLDSLTVICPAKGSFSQGQVIPVEEFVKQRFLLREHGSGTRETFEHALEAYGFTVTPVWESVSTTALVNGVINGLGVAVLPQRMVQGALRQGLVHSVQIKGLEFNRKFRIVYHKNKYLTEAARAFIELCKTYEENHHFPVYDGLS